MSTYCEPGGEIPIVEQCDVLVAGAGPAGVAAAIAAGRVGAKVTLLETHGQLGGIWTSGALAWILDTNDKAGLMPEILDRLRAAGASRGPTFGAFACDVERMKLLLEQMCAEANANVRLHTRVVSAFVGEDRRMRLAITESKSGREAWGADVFIDCTGDGDLAARAGCAFEMGHPETGRMQPMSFVFVIGGVTHEQIGQYVHDTSYGKNYRDGTNHLLGKLRSLGIEPSYAAPIIMHVYDDLFLVMANHLYGVSGIDANDVTRATLESRREIHTMVDALRASGGEWASVKIVATASQIGVREGRRIRGRYVVTREDLLEGRKFEDGVCRVNFPVDVHSPDPKKSKGFDHGGNKAKPYDIPLRALISADIDNLMMAGRCISGDFIAHSSYRVTGNAVQMGQVAGRCAAIAARKSVLPHQVDVSAL